MTTTQSLLDFILNLLRDGDAKAAFVANPDQALANAGLSDVCSQDVSDAMSYVSEYHPVAYVGDPHNNDYRPDYRPDNDYRSGNDYRPDYQPDSHAAAVQQLEYVSNNYTYADSHDTMIDKSVNENIWNKGTLVQGFDDHSVTATDHSVAAGRDINGEVANGNDNVVGHGNRVGNTTHSDDHSINGSFTSTDIADHGSVAGNHNDGNVTNPDHSDTATNGSEVDNSRHIDNSHTAINSGNTHTATHIDNHPDNSHHIDNHPDNSVIDSGNTTIDHSGNDSLNDHSEIDHSRVSQHGLVNVDHVLSDNNIPLDHLLS
jgi:hypothetical protein